MFPTPPFDFDLSTKIFSDGDKEIRRCGNGKFWQVIRVNDKLVLATVTSSGTVDRPRLLVELRSNGEISNSDKRMAEEMICSLFSLKFDLNPFYNEIRNDKVLSSLVQRLRGLKTPTASTVFEALISSITEQQISLNAANSIQGRMIRTFGDVLELDDEVYYAFPTPQRLASANIRQLRRCGLSLRKSEYIRDISRLVVDRELDLEELESRRDTREIIDELCRIRGIGVWTAELTMLRGMRRLEVIPADDLGLRRHVSHYYCNEREISGEDVRTIAENWGRWKGWQPSIW